MSHARVSLLVATLTILLSVSHSLQGQIISDFNTSDEGWTVVDYSNLSPQTVVHNSAGGYVTTSHVTTQASYWRAPAKFLGQLCVASYGYPLQFDLQISSVTGLQHSGFGDVLLVGASSTLSVNLSAFPAQDPAWTSYSILLDTSAHWHVGTPTGALATVTQIESVLSTLVAIKINGHYQATSGTSSALDNVALGAAPVLAPPVITSISPTRGVPVTTQVTLQGSNFNTDPTQLAVYFGGVKASVVAATASTVTVQVPKGAACSPISLTDLASGRTATSAATFIPAFDNGRDFGGMINQATLGDALAITVATSSGGMRVADMDGDGWNDLIVGESSTTRQFSIFLNTGTSNALSAATFAPKVTFTTAQPYSKAFVAIADFDGDGKLDLAFSEAGVFNAYVSVYRNTSTTGALSFTGPTTIQGLSYSDGPLEAADLDGDGRPEIISVFNNSCASGARLYVFPNRSSPGILDFCSYQTFGNIYTCGGTMSVADMDGDHLSDVVFTTGSTGANISILRNSSTPGAINLDAAFQVATLGGGNVALADFDGDGLTDIAWPGYSTDNIYIKKNNYAGGTFDATAFGPNVSLNSPLGYIHDEVSVGDINGDGKLDLILAGSTDIAVFENTSTPGTLDATSFATGVPFETLGATGYPIDPFAVDLDGDDKPEVLVRLSNSPNLLIYHNESFPVPRIDSYTAAADTVGATTSFAGDFLASGGSTPKARLGKLPVAISNLTNAGLDVTTAKGVVSDRLSVTAHGLTGYSKYVPVKFLSNGQIDANAFASPVEFALTGTPRDHVTIGDLDDDGKPDVLVTENTNALKVLQNTGSAGQLFTAASMTAAAVTVTAAEGVQVFDIDGDGKQDIHSGYGILQNSSTSGTISFLNGPTGASTAVTLYNSAVTSDFNRDGKIDFAVTSGSTSVMVMQNNARSTGFFYGGLYSTFSSSYLPFTATGTQSKLTADDFDGDGYPDMVAVTGSTNTLSVFRGSGIKGPLTPSTFLAAANQTTTGTTPTDLVAGDFDGDGLTDLAVSYSASPILSVYLNTSTSGAISFATPVDVTVLLNGYRLAAQDLDGDGLPEIVVTHNPSGAGSFTVLHNESSAGSLTFTPVNFPLAAYGKSPRGVAIADVTLDGKPDILLLGRPAVTGSSALMVFENTMSAAIIAIDTQPGTTYSVCDGATPVLTTSASGTTNIAYQWQYSIDGVNYNDLADGAVYTGATTASLTVNTAGMQGGGLYRCKVTGDLAAAVYTNLVNFTVNALPATPVVSDVTNCGPGAVTLTASGGTNGNYFWYDSGGLINGESNDTYVTPSLVANASYQVSVTDGTCVSAKATVNAVIASIPSAPTASDVNICKPSQVTLTAGGGANGEYRWYNTAGVLQNGETAATYLTPTNELTTLYYVALNDGTCESVKTQVTVTLNPVTLAAPQITTVPADVSGTVTICLGQTATLDGPAGFVYVWSTTESTQQISVTTSSTVTLIIEDANGCTSPASTVTVVANDCNQPPVITPATSQTTISGTATIDLGPLLSDPDNNLDVTTLKIVTQPASGATATINGQNQLVVDYAGISFVGKDVVTIEVCDLSGKCAQQQIEIDVAGEVLVYNGFSPNNDDKNPVFVIQNIDKMAETRENHVTIYDRWGDAVFETDNYDNTNHVFRGLNKNGGEVPAGTYFYKIEFTSGRKTMTGYLSLKR
ncbi:MAG: FG-GAP-like repeat-containing protein [Cyclobacteriaceae bacterium]